ncbi:hypothetical protein [Komagataeibacter saccharivorans]|uniref:Uncharacterized protein n=1 Tax=Komagataeibacter saccharivorans TaxID=265959 RepID=A0A347WG36_9PROT|nr:hypothetical protein [Komagataeibacter saccharivorans]AXY23829.1 hypothetical protein CD178_03085 [Komagataeibacter saccharivorans]MBL7236878.1 hypothetical protein [Novacetimonas hansenii]QBL95185.1 hypothetical protein KSAC_30060 [Komagataeibacter saccharivorans]
MKKTIHAALLAAVVASMPAMAMAQTEPSSGPAPTADSAASAVGKSPSSATTSSGKRVEPSDKLWNNPRTVSEQPGTQPPANAGTHRTLPGSEGRSSRGGNKTPSPSDSGEQ